MEVKPNWKIALRVWWSIAWRAMIMGVVAGGLMTLLMNTVGRDNEAINLTVYVSSIFISVFLEVWLIRHALRHHYGGFRIAILKKEAP